MPKVITLSYLFLSMAHSTKFLHLQENFFNLPMDVLSEITSLWSESLFIYREKNAQPEKQYLVIVKNGIMLRKGPLCSRVGS